MHCNKTVPPLGHSNHLMWFVVQTQGNMLKRFYRSFFNFHIAMFKCIVKNSSQWIATHCEFFHIPVDESDKLRETTKPIKRAMVTKNVS